MFRLVHELSSDDIDVTVACRVLEISRSGYYDWLSRPPSEWDWSDAHLLNEIRDVHAASRATYGAPRVHAELKLGRGHRIGKKRVARLMRTAGIQGVCHRRKGRHRPAPAVHEDLVKRKFVADRPDRLWVTDVTEHPTREGKVYCCAVLGVFSRRIVGWSIADHIRAEPVVDALQIPTWRRRPEAGAIVHSDRGSVYTSWIFGHRLREAGHLEVDQGHLTTAQFGRSSLPTRASRGEARGVSCRFQGSPRGGACQGTDVGRRRQLSPVKGPVCRRRPEHRSSPRT